MAVPAPAAEDPVFPLEVLYRISGFLPRRWQLELAQSSRATLALLAPLAFAEFVHLRTSSVPLAERVGTWEGNGWLGHVRRVRTDCGALAGVAAVKRLLAGAPGLVSASFEFDEEKALRDVLSSLPASVAELEVVDRCPIAGASAPFKLPALRRVKCRGERLGRGSKVLEDMVAGRPELEELEVSLDESAALADKVRPRVTAWDITDEAAFRRLCNRRDFRPRRIAKTGGGPIGKKSMEALKKLPSVTSVHLAELRSDMILTAGLPESHRELEVDRLYPTLFRVPLGEEFAHDLPGDVPVPIDVRELGKPGGLSRLPREADALGAPGEERPDPDEDYSEFEDL